MTDSAQNLRMVAFDLHPPAAPIAPLAPRQFAVDLAGVNGATDGAGG